MFFRVMDWIPAFTGMTVIYQKNSPTSVAVEIIDPDLAQI